MARTTLDIETPILNAIKELQKKEGETLGRLVSRLLAEALGRRKPRGRSRPFRWVSRRMNPLVDLADKEAVYAALDRDNDR